MSQRCNTTTGVSRHTDTIIGRSAPTITTFDTPADTVDAVLMAHDFPCTAHGATRHDATFDSPTLLSCSSTQQGCSSTSPSNSPTPSNYTSTPPSNLSTPQSCTPTRRPNTPSQQSCTSNQQPNSSAPSSCTSTPQSCTPNRQGCSSTQQSTPPRAPIPQAGLALAIFSFGNLAVSMTSDTVGLSLTASQATYCHAAIRIVCAVIGLLFLLPVLVRHLRAITSRINIRRQQDNHPSSDITHHTSAGEQLTRRTDCNHTNQSLAECTHTCHNLPDRGLSADWRNPTIAPLTTTMPMALIALGTYFTIFGDTGLATAQTIWWIGVATIIAIMIYLMYYFVMRKFCLDAVCPAWLVGFVGILVAAVTSDTVQLTWAGRIIYYAGFTIDIVVLILITNRIARYGLPDTLRATMTIYTAPISLLVASYCATYETHNPLFLLVLLTCAQTLFAFVTALLPWMLATRPSPAWAAFTFPMVITATALHRALRVFESETGWAIPDWAYWLQFGETILAGALILLTAITFVRKPWSTGHPTTDLLR